MTPVKHEFKFGEHTVTLETGEIARQATGAVMISMGDTKLLVTAVAEKTSAPGRDFFPMTVNYTEKTYAVGRIPGGFLKREARPSEHETLTSRLIDRPIRPLFPEGFTNEVQIIATVMSRDPEVEPDMVALLGASAALTLTGAPFNGPIGACRVGYKNGEYILNPGTTAIPESDLNLVVAGTDSAVLMVESEADLLSEEVMLGAVVFGHEQLQVAITGIREFAQVVGVVGWDWKAEEKDQTVATVVAAECETAFKAGYQIKEKLDRYDNLSATRKAAIAKLTADGTHDEEAVRDAMESLEKRIVRTQVLAGEPRIDGRDTRTVRPISVKTGILPRAHGSALFTRGETQAIVVATLGTERDSQVIDALEGSYREPFMLQYNFPPFSVGETGRTGMPGRREIGHGRLAKRGVLAIMPKQEDFSYSMRVVSEITESNGSSSMASVCGTSLALMDAGVPIKEAVAGIAMGLIKEGEKFAILSDILGDEDHLGDMDFKVAGSVNGITALQMDIKIEGITKEIMEIALGQAKEGRLFILGEMNKVLSEPRVEMSAHAPRYLTFKINPDKIRDVIGKGGATIRSITEQTGTSMDITDDGMVKIASSDGAAAEEAKRMVEQITAEVEVGKVYEGKVAKLMDFGAFVTILPGKDGLVHVSQISEERVEKVSDELTEGESVKVKVLEIDKQGRIRLSMKAVTEEEKASA